MDRKKLWESIFDGRFEGSYLLSRDGIQFKRRRIVKTEMWNEFCGLMVLTGNIRLMWGYNTYTAKQTNEGITIHYEPIESLRTANWREHLPTEYTISGGNLDDVLPKDASLPAGDEAHGDDKNASP